MKRTCILKRPLLWSILSVGIALVALSGCDESVGLNLLNPKDNSTVTPSSRSTRIVERDIEAPDVFQVTENGLWDGRSSLGGVWVAHPDTSDPERVIIRNTANGKFVIGALFRREGANPGPRLQVSSDAASALGLPAGQPAELNVTALRREDVPNAASAEDAETSSNAVETPVEQIATIDAPVSYTSSTLAKPFIQIGIFSVKQNADNAAAAMRQAGMNLVIREHTGSGKKFWRVLVGPAQSGDERDAYLKKVKARGFADAYPVTH